MRKKLLSLALALVLCLGLTVPAAAAVHATAVYSSELDCQFSEGLAPVREGSEWGYIDATGAMVIPCQFSSAKPFSGGLAQVSQGGMKGGTYGFIDTSGKMVVVMDTQKYEYGEFHDGLVSVKDKKTSKYGYIDKNGNLAVECKYSGYVSNRNFSCGRAMVYDSDLGFYGYIDAAGREVIPCQFSDAKPFVNGIAFVMVAKDVWKAIDVNGKMILPDANHVVKDDRLSGSSGRTLADTRPAGLVVADDFTFYDVNGKVVVPSGKYIQVGHWPYGPSSIHTLDGSYIAVRVEGGDYFDQDYWGLIDGSGREIIPCQYSHDAVYRIDSYGDGYFQTVTDVYGGSTDRWLYDSDGNLIMNLEELRSSYKFVGRAGNGRILVASDATGTVRYGYVDLTGKEVIPCKYKEAEPFANGIAIVRNFDYSYGLIDTEDNEILPCQYGSLHIEEDGKVVVATPKAKEGSGYTVYRIDNGMAAPSSPSTPAQPSGPSANPTNSKVLVNGKEVAFDAYTIDGSNYFKLRDLAYVLSGTEKQFEVGWDNASKTITLTSGQGYTANGSEMASKSAGSKAAAVSASKLLIDGKEVALTAYTIDGNNYFKLRDIGQAFDFGIGWDNASKTITIDTSAGYTA